MQKVFIEKHFQKEKVLKTDHNRKQNSGLHNTVIIVIVFMRFYNLFLHDGIHLFAFCAFASCIK